MNGFSSFNVNQNKKKKDRHHFMLLATYVQCQLAVKLERQHSYDFSQGNMLGDEGNRAVRTSTPVSVTCMTTQKKVRKEMCTQVVPKWQIPIPKLYMKVKVTKEGSNVDKLPNNTCRIYPNPI